MGEAIVSVIGLFIVFACIHGIITLIRAANKKRKEKQDF